MSNYITFIPEMCELSVNNIIIGQNKKTLYFLNRLCYNALADYGQIPYSMLLVTANYLEHSRPFAWNMADNIFKKE